MCICEPELDLFLIGSFPFFAPVVRLDHGAGEKRQQEFATLEVVAMNNERQLLV